MSKNAYWRYIILQCMSIAALMLVDIYSIQISRAFAFFVFTVAAILISPNKDPFSRPAGVMLQIPYMAFLDRYHVLSAGKDTVISVIFFICIAVTIFLIHRLRLRKEAGTIASITAASLYYSAFARVEPCQLIFPAILLNLIFFVILSRTIRFQSKDI